VSGACPTGQSRPLTKEKIAIMRRAFAALSLALALLGPAQTVGAQTPPPTTPPPPPVIGSSAIPPVLSFKPGAVVQLVLTPHLWIADEQGVLHWGGDTRALGGHYIDWDTRTELSIPTLTVQQRGDPWLTMGLLKIGDPIYLVKWETEEPAPTLWHIQCIRDVELFGINEKNYGNFVLDKLSWERRYGMTADGLAQKKLATSCSTDGGAGGTGGTGGTSGGTSGGSSGGGGGGTSGGGGGSSDGGGSTAGGGGTTTSPTTGDRQAPTGTFLGEATDAQGRLYMEFSFQDAESGLASIGVRCQNNAVVTGQTGFSGGTKSGVTVRVTEVSSASTVSAVIEVVDTVGNRGELVATHARGSGATC
jgi:hypothetical protein